MRCEGAKVRRCDGPVRRSDGPVRGCDGTLAPSYWTLEPSHLRPVVPHVLSQKSICRLSLMKRGGMMLVGMRHPESVASR